MAEQRRWAWCRAGSCHANLQAIERAVEVGTFTIHFIDEGDTRNVIFVRLSPNGFALCFDTFAGGEDNDTAVENSERAFDFSGEIDVSWRVDEVAKELGCSAESVRRWKEKALQTAEPESAASIEQEANENKRLRKRVAQQ